MVRVLAFTALLIAISSKSLSMSPQEIADQYARLIKSYPACALVRACLEDRQEDAINLIKKCDINQQEPRFGKLSSMYEYGESYVASWPAGESKDKNYKELTLKKRRSGYTALHYATINRSYVLFAKLLQEQAINPNLQDVDGNTPLHHAVLQVAPMFVYDLAQHTRCNPYLANNKQQTAISLAYQLKDIASNAKIADDLRVIINILNMAMDKTTYTDNPFVNEDSLQLELTYTQNEA